MFVYLCIPEWESQELEPLHLSQVLVFHFPSLHDGHPMVCVCGVTAL